MADDDLSRDLAAFNAEYLAGVPQRLIDIDTAWSAVKRGEAEALRPLLRQLHSIAGSAPTFGLAALGKAAARAEDWIEPYDARSEIPPAAALDAFEPLLEAVRQAARS